MTETPDGSLPEEEPVTDGTPLGRYAPDPLGAPLHRVHLLSLPLPLLLSGREHHDGVMREFRLLALSKEFARSDAPTRLVQLVSILGHQYAATRERRDEEIDAALRRGEESIDQTFSAPATAAVAVRALMELLDEADEYCEQARLLSLPRPLLLREFSNWYLGQVVGQIEGGQPRPWDGPLRL